MVQIGIQAFQYCSSLKKLFFHDNSKLKVIDKYAFFICPINCISLPSNITELGNDCFALCSGLQIIEISENSKLVSLNLAIFRNSTLGILLIPDKL